VCTAVLRREEWGVLPSADARRNGGKGWGRDVGRVRAIVEEKKAAWAGESGLIGTP
jgi:hypothetical protein